jgi:hypothetical protein
MKKTEAVIYDAEYNAGKKRAYSKALNVKIAVFINWNDILEEFRKLFIYL